MMPTPQPLETDIDVAQRIDAQLGCSTRFNVKNDHHWAALVTLAGRLGTEIVNQQPNEANDMQASISLKNTKFGNSAGGGHYVVGTGANMTEATKNYFLQVGELLKRDMDAWPQHSIGFIVHHNDQRYGTIYPLHEGVPQPIATIYENGQPVANIEASGSELAGRAANAPKHWKTA